MSPQSLQRGAAMYSSQQPWGQFKLEFKLIK